MENRSNEIWRDVNQTLDILHKESKGTAWTPSYGGVKADWILASPEGFWGLQETDHPKNFECTPGDAYGLVSNSNIIQAKPWEFTEIAEALIRGVNVRVIQSDTDVGPNDYTLVKYQKAHDLLIQNTVDYATSRGFKVPSSQPIRAYFCGLVQYAPIRYVDGKTRWDKEKGHGSHAKLMMVDSSAFYMGSHNYYAANLQEFGLIVADQSLTNQLQRTYWEPIWNISQNYIATCNG